MEKTEKTAHRPLSKKTYILTAVIVIGLNIINCSAINIAYSSLSSNVLYSSTALPQLLFYLMAVINTVALFIGAAAIIYSGTAGDKKGVIKSSIILFSGLLAATVTTLLIYALDYSSEYFWSIISANLTNLLLQMLLNLGRVVFLAVVSVYLYLRRDFSIQLNKKAFIGALFISGITAIIELFEATIPFFQEYGLDVYANSYFTIALAYIIMAVHAVLGYYICKLCFAIYEK